RWGCEAHALARPRIDGHKHMRQGRKILGNYFGPLPPARPSSGRPEIEILHVSPGRHRGTVWEWPEIMLEPLFLSAYHRLRRSFGRGGIRARNQGAGRPLARKDGRA